MAKYTRWDPKNKKAGRKKNRSKLGLSSRFGHILSKELKNDFQTLKQKVGLR